MQLLFESSEESPGEEGLGIISGAVTRFLSSKVPLIGWNQLTCIKPCNVTDSLTEDTMVILFAPTYPLVAVVYFPFVW
jgi:imidazole glycerol-phosphate synthase